MGYIVPGAVESYLASLNRTADPLIEEVAAAGRDLPLIDPEVGALLHVLALAVGAKRILEIGTAIGYSGLWLARGLPADGMLLTIELDPERARTARAYFERAGVADRANVLVGDAHRLIAKVAGPFDLIFQDCGDKLAYEAMLERLVTLLRPGGLLITDNVLSRGEVVPGFVEVPTQPEAKRRTIASYNERLVSHPELITSIVPLRDGVAISAKKRA